MEFNESMFLTREELTEVRPVSSFCNWVESKTSSWAAVSRNTNEGKELHRHVLLRKGLFAPFHQEAFPLYRYLQASGLVDSSYQCSLTLDSSLHYDATLTDQGGHSQKLEITQALEERHDVRMEQLLEHGHVTATGEMTISGTRRTGRTVILDEDMVLHDTTVTKAQHLVIQAVKRKTTDQTKNQNYTSDTKLLVALDDHIIDEEDHESLEASWNGSILAVQDTFCEVIVVGLSGRLILAFS